MMRGALPGGGQAGGRGRLPRHRWVLGALAAAYLLGCAPDLQPDASDFPCRVEVEFLAELGQVDDPVGIVEWHDWRNIVRTAEGRWIVRPLLVPQLLLYAPDGSFERTIGRAGDGPGEFRDHSRISVDRSDSIWVSDQGRAVVLDPTGSHARTIVNPGYAVEGFTPSNEPYSLLVRVFEPRGDPHPYVIVRSRDLEPRRGFGPGLDDPRTDGRTIRAVGTGTVFDSDSTLLTDLVEDRDRGWIDRWTPTGHEPWLHRLDVWRAIGEDEDPPPWDEGSFINLGVTSDNVGGFWSVAVVERPTPGEPEARHFLDFEPQERTRAFASFLLHITGEGTITAVTELPEAPREFVDHEHLAGPWLYEDTGLITMRVWRFRRECGPG